MGVKITKKIVKPLTMEPAIDLTPHLQEAIKHYEDHEELPEAERIKTILGPRIVDAVAILKGMAQDLVIEVRGYSPGKTEKPDWQVVLSTRHPTPGK